jgi:hypothetical protein
MRTRSIRRGRLCRWLGRYEVHLDRKLRADFGDGAYNWMIF